MDEQFIRQHKRMAMGMAVNNEPAGASKNMVNDMVKPHKSYGIHKNTSGTNDKHAQSKLEKFKK